MKQKLNKTKVHFVANYLLQPTNPLTVNLIGCGGTGTKMLVALADMNLALGAFRHPGLAVRVFDKDKVSKANVGRGFVAGEIGLNKAAIQVSRINRSYGTNWKACDYHYAPENMQWLEKRYKANITICCVDEVAARFEIAALLKQASQDDAYMRDKPFYSMDFGNSQSTGQVILSTVGNIAQPRSKKYIPVGNLPPVTEEFGDLLQQSEQTDNTPSCSLPDALSKQDLFINAALAAQGASMLFNLLRKGMTSHRGFFMNLWDCRQQPLKIE